MSKEEWKETNYPGYFVSNLGNVRGRRGHILKPSAGGNKRSYLYVVCGKGVGSKSVHKLVAEAFLGPCPPDHEVAHLNGNSFDNRAVNLTYKTHQDNEADKTLHGTRNAVGSPGESNGRVKLTETQVLDILSREEPINKSALSREFNVSRRTILGIINRETWSHLNV